MTERVERHHAADRDAVAVGADAVEPFGRPQTHEHVGLNNPLLHKRQQIAASTRERRGAAGSVRLLCEFYRVFRILRGYVRKGLHANTPSTRSRVIGKSFTRFPIALNTALAIAPGARTMPDSPRLLARRPRTRRHARRTTRSGASRCVGTTEARVSGSLARS